MQKFRQSSIVFKRSCILFKNFKALRSSNYPTVQYFLLKLRTPFLLTNVFNKVCGILFYFVQIVSYFQKLKRPGFQILLFDIFINNSRSKQNKKNTELTFLNIVKQKMGAKFQQQILNSGSWSSSKFSIFQKKKLVSWK